MADERTIDEGVAQIRRCDVRLAGIQWIEQGRDLVLDFVFPESAGSMRLVCRWARGVRIDLELPPNQCSSPFSWDGELKRTENGGWDIDFDFASEGFVALHCSELELFES